MKNIVRDTGETQIRKIYIQVKVKYFLYLICIRKKSKDMQLNIMKLKQNKVIRHF